MDLFHKFNRGIWGPFFLGNFSPPGKKKRRRRQNEGMGRSWMMMIMMERMMKGSNCSKEMMLLMEEILHHLGCIKLVNNGANYRSIGSGFLPSTVVMKRKLNKKGRYEQSRTLFTR